jgi:hypothetical protein
MVSAPASRPVDVLDSKGNFKSVPLVIDMNNIPNPNDMGGSDVW